MEMSQYLEVFIEESKEHIQSCNEKVLLLEQNPEDLTIINDIFRSAHTLKGMSATMGYEDLASLTHKMENVLDGIRNHKIIVTPEIIDIIFMAVDHLEAMINSVAQGGDGKMDVTEVIRKLEYIENGEPDSSASTALEEVAAAAADLEEQKREIIYDDFERTVIQQSSDQGYSVAEITVILRKDCLLKAVRAFMVFDVLEKMGEVIKSVPAVNQLEEEKFDSEFQVTLITNEPLDVIEKKIMNVSEVDRVKTELVNLTENKPSNNVISPEKKEAQPNGTEKKELDSSSQNAPSSKTIRVNIERLDILMNLFEELVIDRGRLEQISKDLRHPELNETVERMSRISSDLQSIILNMRMVPVETVFNRFPRMVRQLAKGLNKKLSLEISGAETELDRTVIDEIGDPLVHLLRNAIDHGIESPEARLAAQKPETGTIHLKAFHSGNHVFIEITDDGAGINRQRVLDKAISKGIISPEDAGILSDNQIYDLIFESGFSTANEISDISGRGVGLDVVKSTIQSLGGSITIDSEEGKGSVFTIQLPLTLSIISAMLVEVGNEKYGIPLSSIIETAIIKKEDILNAHNQKVIDFRGKVIPLVSLKEVFSVQDVQEDKQVNSVVIVKKGNKSAALIVDSFIGQQEIVLKSLGNYLASVFAISGATILGDGQVALIIDCNALIK
ncbi:chemotaxis protein CheA [Heyndrickxia acidicola]|uniref:Chemotaxis protein CheA n=1 Tax=Heyndrickxia acidicola TaxID=209389 RepID=A0ABU6MCA3_9BACI|nr:chemotaxis protein CheA [Heyndrickxia acidicola]MED1202053.1 chemotaxis protein CheA [Heyndrickxia acidicola]